MSEAQFFHPERQATSWDAEADRFDTEADHGLGDAAVRSAWSELLVGVLPPTPARIADLGCGTGTLTRLIAELGHVVDGVDFSPRMVHLAREKTTALDGVHIFEGDADSPPLPRLQYDAVLCRHVLWAMAEPKSTIARWIDLLRPGGRLILIEGNWSTGAGLSAAETVAAVQANGRAAVVETLTDPRLWGRAITDERYLVTSPPPST